MNQLSRIAVLIVAAACLAIALNDAVAAEASKEETQLWNLIKDTTDVEELNVYLATYPEGFYRKQVIRKKWDIVRDTKNIDQIDNYIKANPDSPYLKEAGDLIWHIVDQANTIEMYDRFLKKFPDSPYADMARLKLKKMVERKQWMEVKASKDIDRLKQYIEMQSNSPYITEARKLIWELVRESHDIKVLEDYMATYPDAANIRTAEEIHWHLIRDTNDQGIITDFLMKYPDSRFRGLAKLKLHRLMKRLRNIENLSMVIRDLSTDLVWQKQGGGNMDWQAAKTYCEKLRLTDITDWRLPTKTELTTLFGIKQFFPDISDSDYWSSTEFEDDKSGAWIAGVDQPTVNVDYKRNSHYVRCVRDNS